MPQSPPEGEITLPYIPAQLKSVEAGRGIAAVLVVLYHASGSIFSSSKYWHCVIFDGLFDFGYAGVEFFFVLSGFIIAFAHWSDIGDQNRLDNFIRRRLARIYPVYWLVLGAIIILASIGFGPPLPPAADIFSSILLVGANYHKTIVGVAWTLYHEVLFYAIFSMIIWRPLVGLAVGGAAITVSVLNVTGFELALPLYWQAPVNLLFPMGIVAWRVSLKPWDGAWLAIAAALAFLATGLEVVYVRILSETTTQLMFGAAAACGISGAVAYERQQAIVVPTLLVKLGSASYSIYLVHFALLSAFAQFAKYCGLIDRAPAEAEFTIVVGMTLLASYQFHKFVERPLLAMLRPRRVVS